IDDDVGFVLVILVILVVLARPQQVGVLQIEVATDPAAQDEQADEEKNQRSLRAVRGHGIPLRWSGWIERLSLSTSSVGAISRGGKRRYQLRAPHTTKFNHGSHG